MIRAILGILGLLLCATHLPAHPMGNFSISHYAGLHIDRDSVEVQYLIDMAEIPAFQEMQQGAIPAEPNDPRVTSYLKSKAVEFAKGLSLSANGVALSLKNVSQEVIFPMGAGNLPTMKFRFIYRAALSEACRGGPCEVSYQDLNFPGRAGWKEIVSSLAPGIRLVGDKALTPDRSSLLSNYPTDLLNSPPQDLTASITFTAPVATTPSRVGRMNPPSHLPNVETLVAKPTTPGEPPKPLQPVADLLPNRQVTPRNAFTELMGKNQLSLGLQIMAFLVAAGLGALHALEPGHGKTIVAAYLVGSRGNPRHALLLGLIVTLSHTAGVYLLGGVTLFAQRSIMPDRLYPFLGVMSGMLVFGMGCYLLLQRIAGSDLALLHSHGPGGHRHDGLTNSSAPKGRHLALLGITGGIVPCPAALVVLLSAAALHRVAFGLFLIVAFSLGLATVLIAMGLAVVYAGRILSQMPIVEGSLVRRWLPIASAVMITILGCVIAVRGLMAAGIVRI